MAHLKRYNIPTYWKIPKKAEKFVIRPSAGPHERKGALPLRVLLRDVLKLAENSREVNMIIKNEMVLVDKKERKDPKFPVGLMDVVEFPKLKKAFRVNVNDKGLVLEEIKKGESERKLCRIRNKVSVRGGKTQLNLHDGRCLLVDKDVYSTSDSVLIKLPEQNIVKHFKFGKGAPCIIVSGRNIGKRGKIKDIFERKSMLERSRVVLETKEKDIETVKDYILVGDFK